MAVQKWYRYSEAFKRQVVSEIESGSVGIDGARRRYGIGGCGTIPFWLRKYGKNHLLGRVIRVEKPEERDQLKAQAERIRELESALADAHIAKVALESLVEVAGEEYGVDLKKSFGAKLLAGGRRKPRDPAAPVDPA